MFFNNTQRIAKDGFEILNLMHQRTKKCSFNQNEMIKDTIRNRSKKKKERKVNISELFCLKNNQKKLAIQIRFFSFTLALEINMYALAIDLNKI